jgi:fucose 4-O-acetylase-like acetyltransferase
MSNRNSRLIGNKHHIPEIAALSSFAILLVVFGHARISNNAVHNPGFYLSIREIIYSFHMHLFMFVSGYLFFYTNMHKKPAFKEILHKKIVRLLLPYLLLLSLVFIFRFLGSQLQPIQSTQTLQRFNYFLTLIHPDFMVIDYYWFLLALFVIFCFSILLLFVIKTESAIMYALLTGVLLTLHYFPLNVRLFCLSRVSEFAVFFWFGGLFLLYENYMRKPHSSLMILILSVLMVLMQNTDVAILSVPKAIAGILLMYYLAIAYTKADCHFLKMVSGYTFQIYLLSWFFHKGAEVVAHRFFGYGFYIVFPISFLGGLIGPIMIAKLIQRKYPRIGPAIGLKLHRTVSA